MTRIQALSRASATASRAQCSRIGAALALILFVTSTAALAAYPQWVRAVTSQGSGSVLANAVKVAANGDQYVTGQFSSSARFSTTTLRSAGGLDVFLVKIGAPRKLAWVVQVGGTQDDLSYGLDLDELGNAYITGNFIGVAQFGSTNGATKIVRGSGQNIFVAKYSSSGVLLWVQTGASPNGTGVNRGTGLAVNFQAGTLAGTLTISAIGQGPMTFSSANGTANTVDGRPAWHMLVAKYDTNGNFKWAQTNAGSPNSVPNGIAVDANDNAYVTGWLENATTFGSADGRTITVIGLSPAQSNTDYPDDGFLAKYDRNGNVKWVNDIGGYKANGNAVAVSPSGNITLVGFVGNINAQNPNFKTAGEARTLVTSQPPGVAWNLGGGDFTVPYNPDVVVATYSPAGVLQLAFRSGTSAQEAATSVAYDFDGNLYLAYMSVEQTGRPNLVVLKYHYIRGGFALIYEQLAVNAGVWYASTSPAIAVSYSGLFVSGGYTGSAIFGTKAVRASGSTDGFLAQLMPF